MISFLFFILYICTIGEKAMMATSSVPWQEAKFRALARGKAMTPKCLTCHCMLYHHAYKEKKKRKKKDKESLFHFSLKIIVEKALKVYHFNLS